MAALVVARRPELADAHVARIKRRYQPPDRPTLARGVPTLEEHAHGWPEPLSGEQPAELEAKSEQPLLRRCQASLALLGADLELQVNVAQ